MTEQIQEAVEAEDRGLSSISDGVRRAGPPQDAALAPRPGYAPRLRLPAAPAPVRAAAAAIRAGAAAGPDRRRRRRRPTPTTTRAAAAAPRLLGAAARAHDRAAGRLLPRRYGPDGVVGVGVVVGVADGGGASPIVYNIDLPSTILVHECFVPRRFVVAVGVVVSRNEVTLGAPEREDVPAVIARGATRDVFGRETAAQTGIVLRNSSAHMQRVSSPRGYWASEWCSRIAAIIWTFSASKRAFASFAWYRKGRGPNQVAASATLDADPRGRDDSRTRNGWRGACSAARTRIAAEVEIPRSASKATPRPRRNAIRGGQGYHIRRHQRDAQRSEVAPSFDAHIRECVPPDRLRHAFDPPTPDLRQLLDDARVFWSGLSPVIRAQTGCSAF